MSNSYVFTTVEKSYLFCCYTLITHFDNCYAQKPSLIKYTFQ